MIVTAVLVLLGWAVGAPTMTSVFPRAASMKVNTALCLLALSLSLLLPEASRLRPVLLAFAFVVASLVLAEHVTGTGLGIDELLWSDPASAGTNAPGQMAPATAVGVIALALSQAALMRGRRTAASATALVAALIGGLGVIAYGFGVESMYGVGFAATVAFNTAVALVALAAACALVNPSSVLVWVLQGRGAGSILMRRMAPVAIIAVPALGAVHLAGETDHVYDQHVAIALTVTLAGGLILGVSILAARRLDEVDDARAATLHELEMLNSGLVNGRDEEWRRAEELSRSLELERAMFRRAVAKVDDLVWTLEIGPDAEPTVVFSTSNAGGLFGGELPAGTEVLQRLHELCHPADVMARDRFQAQVAAGRPAEVELRVVGLDERVRWVWSRATPRRTGGRLYADGITTNVTDRHELADKRDRLLAAERDQVRQLREINRLREEFLAITGHELRTPLSAIRGYADLLLEDPDVDGRRRRQVEVIAKRARQLHQLVDDLFELTRFGSGLDTLHLEDVVLGDLLRDVVDAHRPAAKEGRLEVTCTGLDATTLRADPVRLRQVMDNLLTNAVRYTRPGGTIQVTSARPDVRTVEVQVIDDGIGIPEREREWVFDRMFRATSAHEAGIQGTGLGLAVVRTLVEAHDGQVAVEANPGGGTVFTVRLPVAGPHPQLGALPAEPLGNDAVAPPPPV